MHWQDDVREAEHPHVNYPDIVNELLERNQKKQQLHVGDRSHPQVQALDSLTGSGPTYNGWQDDVPKAEEMAHNDFDNHLIMMRKKQSMHEVDRSHLQL